MRGLRQCCSVLLLGIAACGTETITKIEYPDCSATAPQGECPAGQTCFNGACVEAASLCSPTNMTGTCASGTTCMFGGCILSSSLCSAANPVGVCDTGKECFEGSCVASANMCSPTNLTGTCPAGTACIDGGCLVSTALCSSANPTGICGDVDKACLDGTCVFRTTLCGTTNLAGACPSGRTCFLGGCADSASMCSATNKTGACDAGKSCLEGTCVLTASLCSAANPTGACPAGNACSAIGICTPPAVDPCTVKVYTEQPVVQTHGSYGTDYASATITLNAVVPGNNVSVGGWSAFEGGLSFAAVAAKTFTGVASGATDGQFNVDAGTDDTVTAANLAAAINASSAAELVTATATAKVVTITAKTRGVLGNGINLAGTATRFAISGPTGSVKFGTGTGKGILTVDGKQFRDSSGDGQLQLYEDWRYNEFCRAKDLAARLGRVEKIGLLKSGVLASPPANGATYLTSALVGSLKNARYRQGMTNPPNTGTPATWAQWHNNMEEFTEADTWGIPALAISDPIHTQASGNSWATWLPGTLAMGAMNDLAYTQKAGDIIRQEFMARGVRMEYGPMADIATEPRWTRIEGTFGENPFAVANHVRAFIKGFQHGDPPDLRNGIIAMVKHFPGHGAEYDGYDYHGGPRENRWAIFPGNNFAQHWIPFQAAFDVGAAGLMPCYTIYVGQYDWSPEQWAAGFSHGIITRLAKEHMGFKGFVSGDWGTLTNAYGQETLSEKERSVTWFRAGSHQWGDNLNGTYMAYDDGTLDHALVDNAAAKVLEAYMKLGLFENPYIDPANATAVIKKAEFRQFGFDGMKRSVVILRNSEHTAASGGGGGFPPPPGGGGSSGTAYLPISGARKTTGATPSYICDSNTDGAVMVYYEGSSVKRALNGSDYLDDIRQPFDYRVTTPAAGELAIDSTSDLGTADIWVYRMNASVKGYDTDQTAARNRIIDVMRIRDGYTKSDGTVVPAVNPNLKIVVVINVRWAPIVKWLVNGLNNWNETPGVAGSYPSVDTQANIRTSTGRGVDAMLAEFYNIPDRAVLDVLFKKNLPDGVTAYGQSVLPIEFPSSVEAVAAQYEDLPADSVSPSFQIGFKSLTY